MAVERFMADLLADEAKGEGPATVVCPSCGSAVTVADLLDPCPSCNLALVAPAARLKARLIAGRKERPTC